MENHRHLPDENNRGFTYGVNPANNEQATETNDDPLQNLDPQITAFAQLSREVQREMWATDQFATQFPHIVRRLLSPEGRARFSDEMRNTIYKGSLYALEELALKPRLERRPIKAIRGIPQIGGTGMYFDLNDGTSRRPGGAPDNMELLFRVNLTSIILLGVSLPDASEIPALKRLVDTFSSAKSNVSWVIDSLGLLLPLNALARKWVKENQLDQAAGREWDTVVSELIVNLPRYAIEPHIDPNKKRPRQLPSEMTTTDASTYYSPEAYAVFTDYAADLAAIYTDESTNPDRVALSSRLLQDFAAFRENIRWFPKDFKDHTLIKTAMEMVAIATYNPQTQGSIPIARDLLPSRKRRQPAVLRWYHPAIRQLLS